MRKSIMKENHNKNLKQKAVVNKQMKQPSVSAIHTEA